MKTLEEVFGALRGQGRLEWIGQEKAAAVLYFQRGRSRFKIYFDDSNVEVSQLRRWFKEEYWDSLGARHYDAPEDTVDDLFDTVMWCLKEYGGRGRKDV